MKFQINKIIFLFLTILLSVSFSTFVDVQNNLVCMNYSNEWNNCHQGFCDYLSVFINCDIQMNSPYQSRQVLLEICLSNQCDFCNIFEPNYYYKSKKNLNYKNLFIYLFIFFSFNFFIFTFR